MKNQEENFAFVDNMKSILDTYRKDVETKIKLEILKDLQSLNSIQWHAPLARYVEKMKGELDV